MIGGFPFFNPLDPFDWKLAELEEQERRSKLTRWQRFREDAALPAFLVCAFLFFATVFVGPWAYGVWTIMKDLGR